MLVPHVLNFTTCGSTGAGRAAARSGWSLFGVLAGEYRLLINILSVSDIAHNNGGLHQLLSFNIKNIEPKLILQPKLTYFNGIPQYFNA